MKDRQKEFISSITNNHSVQMIRKIFKVSNLNPNKIFENLYQILCDEPILYLAFSNIANNKGSNTPGTTPQSIDRTSRKLIEEIQNELKERKYKFSPFRRIMIDKPLKHSVFSRSDERQKGGRPGDKKNAPKKQRPLGIPEWKDRIVQEALRLILNAIYEPLFYKEGNNYGFRPKLGCQHAIQFIKTKGRGLQYALEGDIVGAYDNVNFEILLTILKRKISDKPFIDLIKNSLQCGLMFKKQFEETLIGVPQGSIVSPLFFNIYMHEFDKFVLNDLSKSNMFKHIQKRNKKLRRKHVSTVKTYNFQAYRTIEANTAKYSLKKITQKREQDFPRKKTNYELLRNKRKLQFEERNLKHSVFPRSDERRKGGRLKFVLNYKSSLKKLKNQQLKLKTTDPAKNQKRIIYVRYADDWIILSNIQEKSMNILREKCQTFLQNNLKLKLSEEKTKITNLDKKQAKFLGFSIEFYKDKITRKKVFTKDKKLISQHPQRTTSGLIKIGLDRERIMNRLLIKSIINKFEKPIASRVHSILTTYDIIQYYNSVIRGFINYYAPCTTYGYYLNFVLYLLGASCYHTLAQKYRTRVNAIIKKYGKPITINIKIDENNTKFCQLIYMAKMTKPLIEKAQKREQILNTELKYDAEDINFLIQNEDIKDPFSFKFLNIPSFPVPTKFHFYEKGEDLKDGKGEDLKDGKGEDLKDGKGEDWRAGTMLKATNCCICGISDQFTDIQIHHTRHIAKNAKEGFGQIINQINRKQIPVCTECHVKIHNGTYDGIKLTDLAIPQYVDMEFTNKKKD